MHKETQRQQRQQAEIWFAQFDNGDGVLQRTELAALLKHTSAVEPSEEALDMALADAKAADIRAGGQPTDGVSKKSAVLVVTKFSVRHSAISPRTAASALAAPPSSVPPDARSPWHPS